MEGMKFSPNLNYYVHIFNNLAVNLNLVNSNTSKKDTNGQIKKILYLRSGNSSRIIPQEEMEAFIRERF